MHTSHCSPYRIEKCSNLGWQSFVSHKTQLDTQFLILKNLRTESTSRRFIAGYSKCPLPWGKKFVLVWIMMYSSRAYAIRILPLTTSYFTLTFTQWSPHNCRNNNNNDTKINNNNNYYYYHHLHTSSVSLQP